MTCSNAVSNSGPVHTFKQREQEFKNKDILILKPKLSQKYILMDKALIHKKKYKIKNIG